MRDRLSVLIVGAECAPFAKVGGLADVIGALPVELNRQGVDARVMIPLHKKIKEKYFEKMQTLAKFYVNLGWRKQYAGILTMQFRGVTFYFVDSEYYFGTEIYRGGEAEGEQYSFFSRAVLESLSLIDFIPDVIHCNDWHTGIIPMLIKTQYRGRPQGGIKTLYTIHNLAYQGKFSQGFIQDMLGIGPEYYNSECIEAYGCANFLKSALVFADLLNTVSPTYASEIMTQYFGEGMDGVLCKRSADLSGILNGMDTELYDPSRDKALYANYTYSSLENRRLCKADLMNALNLGTKLDTPIIGVVTRMTSQKGLDLIVRVMDEIMSENVAMVVVGSGERQYEDFFMQSAYKYCGRLSVKLGYDDELARKVYAGSDFFLMPSKFEPCGISQMIAMRYGSLPIVRETGGLADTVHPYNQYTGEGNGFSFRNFNAHDMLNVIRLALKCYANAEIMDGLISSAISRDSSFAVSASEYMGLYTSLAER